MCLTVIGCDRLAGPRSRRLETVRNLTEKRMKPYELPDSQISSITPLRLDELQLEAARYAVLRRMSPSLRHHMIRPLQPITLIYGVISHKLSDPSPDVPAIQAQADKINDFAKDALVQCLDMSSWLAPEPGVLAELGIGVRECVGLLATTLHFRGFHLVNEVDDSAQKVKRDAVRMVLSAALLEITDTLTEPAVVTLNASCLGDEVTLSLQVDLRDEGRVEHYDDGYRKLLWSDVQALAAFEGVTLSRHVNCVTMGFAVEPAVAATA